MNLPPTVERLWSWLSKRGRRAGQSARSLLTNEYFWAGFAFLLLVLFGFYLLVDRVLLPEYTRHDVAIEVPNVTERPFDEAQGVLARYDLRAERVTQRFNPDLPRGIVIDQDPPGHSRVKPGRRVYLTVNAGDTPMVTLPDLAGMSLREARNRVRALGLEIEEEQPDSIPSPHRNTITRQQPAPGDSLAEGASVTLWYSTGLGDAIVSVPDVTGLSVVEAREQLLALKLRSVVLHPSDSGSDEEADSLVVIRQSREPGTRVREGFELRLFLGEPEEASVNEADN